MIILQMATKGWAQYNLFCSMKEESMVFESQSSVIANLKWNNVEKILECPPLSSVATLVSNSASRALYFLNLVLNALVNLAL